MFLDYSKIQDILLKYAVKDVQSSACILKILLYNFKEGQLVIEFSLIEK